MLNSEKLIILIIDIDECKTGNNCTSPATCSNTEGSYTCVCPSGYTKSGQYGCTGTLHTKYYTLSYMIFRAWSRYVCKGYEDSGNI